MPDIDIEFKKLDAWQREVYLGRRRFTVVAAARRIGKSTLTTKIVVERFLGIHDQMEGKVKGKRILIAHPNSSYQPPYWRALHELLDPMGGLVKWNETNKTIEYGDGLIKMVSLEAGMSLRGSEWDLLICDEVAFCPDFAHLWDNVIAPTLRSSKLTHGEEGQAIFISTFNGIGDWFYESYRLGQDGGDPNWVSFLFDVYSTNLYTREDIEGWRKSARSEASWEVEYLCNPEVSNSPFGSHIFKNVIEMPRSSPVCFGLDLASQVDFTSITGIDSGYRVCYHRVFRPRDWNEVRAAVNELPRTLPITMDTTGVGRVLYDEFRGTHKIRPYLFTQDSKIQLIERLINAVSEGQVWYPRQIADEMTMFEGVRLPTGKYRYQARPGSHDDQVISLALALEGRNNAGKSGSYSVLRGG